MTWTRYQLKNHWTLKLILLSSRKNWRLQFTKDFREKPYVAMQMGRQILYFIVG
jgi:hypothetical protein